MNENLKGRAVSTLTVAEPGGRMDGWSLVVAGAVQYSKGERVTLFLRRFANGEYRTVGWAQGKFAVGKDGLVHGATGDMRVEGRRPSEFRTQVLALVSAERQAR